VQLEQSPFLDIVADDRIRETLDSMNRAPDAHLTYDVTREVCQRLGVKAMLQGTIAPLGTHYVLSLVATDCATGESIARAQAEAQSKEQVLSELGSITRSLRTSLGESLRSIQSFGVPIEQASTPSLPALKAYALGLEERRRGRELESIPFFNQAIDLDPEFASAYTMLSTVYGSVGELRRSGLSILLVEQNLPLALAVVDRVHILSRGQIVHSARPDELAADEAVKSRYLGVT